MANDASVIEKFEKYMPKLWQISLLLRREKVEKF